MDAQAKVDLHSVWHGIKDRCGNPNSKDFYKYGGRGITVCDRWARSFEAFCSDMGERPFHKAQIDRIDNNKGYSSDNCRWTTNTLNCRNKRNSVFVTFNGETRHFKEWSEILGIAYYTLRSRIYRSGWTVEKAFTTPVEA